MRDAESIAIRNRLGFIDDENPFPVSVFNSLVPESYDYISLGYTGDDLTSVIYKNGGSSGTVVATLTLAYTNGNLVSVDKS